MKRALLPAQPTVGIRQGAGERCRLRAAVHGKIPDRSCATDDVVKFSTLDASRRPTRHLFLHGYSHPRQLISCTVISPLFSGSCPGSNRHSLATPSNPTAEWEQRGWLSRRTNAINLFRMARRSHACDLFVGTGPCDRASWSPWFGVMPCSAEPGATACSRRSRQ